MDNASNTSNASNKSGSSNKSSNKSSNASNASNSSNKSSNKSSNSSNSSSMVAVKDNPYGVKGKASEIGGNSILQRLPVCPHSAWDVFLLVTVPASQVQKQNVI